MRDAALARVRRTRRWVLLATAGLTAGFAALVSAVAPGRSLASKAPASGVASSASTASASTASASTASGSGSALPSMPAPAGAGQLGLAGPNELPSPGQSQSSSGPSQSTTGPSQSQSSAPAQPQTAPAPQPAAPPVVSGGS